MPSPGTRLLVCAGDVLDVTLRVPGGERPGRAVFRTNLGQAARRRAEIVAHTERDEPPLARDWHDLPMQPVGHGLFRVRVPLLEVGWFAGKACFIPAGSETPEWPDGENLIVKVAPAHTACANTLYTAFVRQFGPALTHDPRTHERQRQEAELDGAGYTVIPPSGTFRDLIRHLDVILDSMRFRILQLLPIHPTPTTFARMGRFGCPFAALDFLDVDPSLAEFDPRATPLDQFRELADAVHARGARLFLDMPANHTGWASTLQIHYPEWFRRAPDGTFASPGAWGVTWADLVELDYSHPELRAAMADVFLFWVRQGVDGFRCDAGYKIPVETWTYIAARVRSEFPDTLFLLEGLGGAVATTEQLLSEANLDWAYSELFQIGDRAAFEQYLPEALALGARTGPLVHYAETHDNDRLASHGETHARLRTSLAALLAQQGAFGIANGVEWFAIAKIDVHGASALNWGVARNQVNAISRLNALLATHPAFAVGASIRLLQDGPGNALAVLRQPAGDAPPLLVLANLDAGHAQPVRWPATAFGATLAWDLLGGGEFHFSGVRRLELAPGQACCLTSDPEDLKRLAAASHQPHAEPSAVASRRRNLAALRIRHWLTDAWTLAPDANPDELGEALVRAPITACAVDAPGAAPALPRVVTWAWPGDTRRVVMVPPGFLLMVRAPHPFRVRLAADERVVAADESMVLADGSGGHAAWLPLPAVHEPMRLQLALSLFAPTGARHETAEVLVLPPGEAARVAVRFPGTAVRQTDGRLCTVLGNGRGAMAQVRAAWGEIRSQYDALLAVNPDPRVPVDRRVFFTRCRAWLRYCGYSQAIDATCLAAFEADPSGTTAAWRFRVPCGGGNWVSLVFRLRLVVAANGLEFEVSRPTGADGLADASAVTVVLRPDIEWRGFHGKTKAYSGPEQAWPAAVQAERHGLVFRPEAGETLFIRTSQGVFHSERQWQYMVGHPDDAARGLDDASDLFSPGWFGIDLRGGERAVVTAAREEPPPETQAVPVPPPPLPEQAASLPLPDALQRALNLYVVRRDDLLTVIAGYPWFLDWGRDTLIVLRGMIAAGRADESLRILREFGRFERQGTLPNMIRGNDDSNRDTSDAPLWFGVAAADLIRVLGPDAVLNAPCGRRTLREALVSIATHYRDGTPNGIRMDPASGLVFSPPHFTWMDTNYPAATPREGYPVEIQALWIAMLDLLATQVDPAWRQLSARARQSLAHLYWLPQEGWLADNLRALPGRPAAQAAADDALRPNQLLALTLGAWSGDAARAASILRACETLLVPGGIRSLADRPVRAELPISRDGRLLNDPKRPYRGQYTGDEDTRRKPAYHNGTAWTWQFPLYAEALVQVYGDAARPAALSLLGSAVLTTSGCVGQMPEILDGDAPHTPRGCVAQAWGVSELLRVWKLTVGPARG